MNETLSHRGPDDRGIWTSEDYKVGLGHRRLSILDLSNLGRNPMEFADGRLRITYNGEIYNFHALRHELEALGYNFRSQTDTEVVLAAYDRWGVECLDRFIGMFSFGIWDSVRQSLFLARDRTGEKPLYYAEYGERFAFASELKALLADPEFPYEIDADAISLYLRYGYIPAPFTPFRLARKLFPAHYAIYEKGHLTIHQYWDPLATALTPHDIPSDLDAIAELEDLLKDCVRHQMISDVPLGAFLSGGIDSSLVVALMQEVGSGPVKTFTIRFENPEFNEADYALAVAQSIGTEHHEETCTLRQMREIIELLPNYFDEPFFDSSSIPTYFLSKLTRQHVTVALSGDGGDESFFGYHRYHKNAKQSSVSESFRARGRIGRLLAWLMPDHQPHSAAGMDLESYAHWNCLWGVPDIQALTSRTVPESSTQSLMRLALEKVSPAERPPLLDLVTYLPEEILTKVDRAAMAASLETRAPLLDHRVIEFALRLPLKMKWRNGQSKWILRQILYPRVPQELLERPKMGFSVPLADWFRADLRDSITSDLNSPLLEELGIDPVPARRLWAEFLAGHAASVDLIWSLYALTSWSRRWSHRNHIET